VVEEAVAALIRLSPEKNIAGIRAIKNLWSYRRIAWRGCKPGQRGAHEKHYRFRANITAFSSLPVW
jgi:hypothetical protein